MEELYAIMRDFLEAEYNLESLSCLLNAAESTFAGEKKEDARMVANGTKFYLNALQEELKAAISRMDTYIAENASKQP